MTPGLSILIVVLCLALFAHPRWNHARNWGYYPFGGMSLVVLVILLLLLSGRI